MTKSIVLGILMIFAPTLAAAPTSCAPALLDARRVRPFFPRGVIFRTESPARDVREAARETLEFRREGPPEHDDELLIPLFVFGRVEPFDLRTVERAGWALALFDRDRWTSTGMVAVKESRAEPTAFEETTAYTELWQAAHELSSGWRTKLRRVFRGAPIYELRLIEAPSHHVRALWLHGGTEDWFITRQLGRLELLDARHFRDLVDATSLNKLHGLNRASAPNDAPAGGT